MGIKKKKAGKKDEIKKRGGEPIPLGKLLDKTLEKKLRENTKKKKN